MTPYTSLPARRQNSFWRTIGMLLLWWMMSLSFSTSLQAQDGDFYQYLSESNSVNEFLKPQLSGRIMPFAGNETINKKRLDQAVSNKNDKGIIATAGNLGLIYLKKENPTTALKYFQMSLAAAERLKNVKAQGIAQIQCGISEMQLRNYDNALSSFEKAAANPESQKCRKCRVPPRPTGTMLSWLTDLPRAEEMYVRAAKSFAGIGQKLQSGACYNSAGEVQVRENDFKRAAESFNAGLQILSGVKENKLKGLLNRNLGLTL
ncbi:MAG: tetratricopeptide repeat protein [Bacteroidetes bacterium]|nr:tetratricopeptide repeat protein [Bacteroidota bacterium]